MEVQCYVFISDDDEERVILSVEGLTEMLRFDFRVASFPQDALEDLQTAVTTERASARDYAPSPRNASKHI